MHDDFHIGYANIDATYRQKLAKVYRSDFDNLPDDDINHPFYASTAMRTRTGAKPSLKSLEIARIIFLQELNPSIKDEKISWSFTICYPTYATTFTTIHHDDPEISGAIEAVRILAENAQAGFRGELAISEEEIAFTLMAPLLPEELRAAMESVLAAVAKSLEPASHVAEVPSTEHSYRLTSMLISVSTMQSIEEYCLQRASAALEGELACVRSLVAVTQASDRYTYRSASDLADPHNEFPAGVREAKFCAWFFTSQEQGDGYLPRPDALEGILVEVLLSRDIATLHVQGRAKQAAALGPELRKGILRIISGSATNCKFAHSNLANCTIMILGLVLAFAAAAVFEDYTGVLIAAGLTAVAAYSYPFLIPRLFPYVIFENAASNHRRRVALRAFKFVGLGIAAPVIVELFTRST